jgi:dienelactone hydrolase
MPAAAGQFNSGGRPIAVEVVRPPAAGRHPAVLIFDGWPGLPPHRSDIMSLADALAAQKIATVIPRYSDWAVTATTAPGGVAVSPAQLQQWKAVCRDALIFARGCSAVDAGRLGVIGFSLGGHLALDLAMSSDVGISLKCVVDFFAPTRVPRLHGDRQSLPPVLIHHGLSDTVVPIDDSIALVTELRAAGKVDGLGYQFIKYPGAGHRFEGVDLEASRRVTVAFVGEVV